MDVSTDTIRNGTSRWGQVNMAGNFAEWVADAYCERYPVAPLGERVDPLPLTHEAQGAVPGLYVARGGSHAHLHPALAFRTSYRSRRKGEQAPESHMDSIGFRLAVDALPD